jgi:hypothetical protein
MKSHALLSLLALPLLLVAGCDWHRIRGNGHVTTEQRPVTDFTSIETGGFYELEWHPGPPSFSLTTDENLLSHITTKMVGKRLEIEMEHGAIAPSDGIKIAITSSALSAAELSGAVEFVATQLNGPKFALETSGAAKITLGGKVNRLLASLTGASKLVAEDLATEDVEVSVTGAGRADVTATNSVRAEITGAGKVVYGGNPKSVQKRITGAGSIRPRD